jgi:acetyltransferase-like isoleucine patch superfamily enzyme
MDNYFEVKNSFSGKLWAFALRLVGGNVGRRVKIISPLKLKNVNRIFIEDDVVVNGHSWLQVAGQSGKLEIGSGSVLGHFNHIFAYKSIIIGKKVLTADKVYISDCSHGYTDLSKAIMDQPVVDLNFVVIGDHTWLGENVVILGVSIGKHCVIGSNSVVLKDIPDYCIAVGSPARVVKRFDATTQDWVKVSD